MSEATSASAQPDVAARLRDTAVRGPDRPALVWQDRTVTYGELDARVDAAVGGLQHLGVRPGDRVAIVLGNIPAFVEAHFGALRAGATVVPLNTELAPDELRHALADSGARLAVVTARVAGTLDGLHHGLPALEHIVVAATSTDSPAEQLTWRNLVDAGYKGTPVERSADDLAAIVYTSGTTGRPRGAMLTRRNLVANQDQSQGGRFRIEPDDSVLLVLPLFHIYALNVGLGASVGVGARMVLVERFDPASTLETLRAAQVSIVLGAPPMYLAWLGMPGAAEAFAGVRVAVSGAAPLPTQAFHRASDELGIEIQEGYGLTEAGPSLTSNAMAAAPRPGSVGLPLPDVELRLVDDSGRTVTEPGDTGEVWARGPNVFVGYWQDEQATASALTPDGWLRTGDVGTFDDDGYLHLVDRLQDLIIVSGFNVYPREVERVLQAHPDVAEVAVVGVPHPYTGEAVKAFVVPRAGAEPTEDDLIAACRSGLARYKCPQRIELVTALPYTATGKVRRVALRGGEGS